MTAKSSVLTARSPVGGPSLAELYRKKSARHTKAVRVFNHCRSEDCTAIPPTRDEQFQAKPKTLGN